MPSSRTVDIQDRAFDFGVRILKFCKFLEGTPGVNWTLSKQLLRSGTSIGANIEEAQAGQSRADFISKMSIALKEARESRYWLRLMIAGQIAPESRVGALKQEAEEIMKIIGAIIVSTKDK